MAHRPMLTTRQRSALFDLPADETSLLKHYILADDDLEHIRVRRRTENRIGFALQLCALRYPGRLLSPGEVIPEIVLTSDSPNRSINSRPEASSDTFAASSGFLKRFGPCYASLCHVTFARRQARANVSAGIAKSPAGGHWPDTGLPLA